jgi:hypothetical protein
MLYEVNDEGGKRLGKTKGLGGGQQGKETKECEVCTGRKGRRIERG